MYLPIKFLLVDDHRFYIEQIADTYYVAIKPITDALGLDYDQCIKELRAHPMDVMKDARVIEVWTYPGHANMLALPEKWIYGWMPNLKAPKTREYYEVLFDSFESMRQDLQEDDNE